MVVRTKSDEKYILDLAAEVLAEPDYRWQHRFPTLLGDPDREGKRSPLPVDAYFPRHRLVIEYWEKQHSAPVPIMDEGITLSGMSRGHQRRLYDQRREVWARANGLRLVILDYRGFETDERGQLRRNPERDRLIVAQALQAAEVLLEPARAELDLHAYVAEIGQGCFICRLLQGDPSLPAHEVIWRNDEAVAFLDRFPATFGHTLVAPAAHYEHVTGDASLHQYLSLQRVVHALSEALRLTLRPERIYILSLGSQQLNAHVHWHVVPCPPGLPPEQQQLAFLDREKRGILKITPEEAQALACQIRAHLPAWMRSTGR